ncbi:DNA-binding transcriptional regulator, XRE-family HTH domain [Pseudomonas cedrina]|uniref:Transcriptional regulator n=2 Tax=Pseudomonas cedrina TaxID=651740 RepID=A0A1V2KKG0_PSECE|nr:helix-turn-helix domain-containing protein [Pseudomonas cedrina]ONH57311.1 transcriptional regulator [Pseudomonas cedrina subsp. cedrina]SDT31279.1 DNA-binding transcriptional regulator, XRE-family HTH domain [Pseudomonas cedrina]
MDASLIMLRLAKQIRGKRLRQGYKQSDLAKLAGVTRQKIIEIEQGSMSVSMGAYARVMAALNCEMELVAARLPVLEELEDIFKD